MVKNLIIAFLVLGFLVQPVAYAQDAYVLAQDDSLTTEEKAELTGTRKQLATIIFCGLAGMILGLSTLSFHGRPQDHLGDIAIGFALGVISGAIYTTYQSATKPYEDFDVASASTVPGLTYSWTF